MRKEGQPNEPRLTLEAVARQASEIMLRDGFHLPTILIEGSRQTAILQLPGMSGTPTERLYHLYAAGWSLGQSEGIEGIRDLFFVTEAWMSLADKSLQRPSDDPKRQEILLIYRLHASTNQKGLIAFELIRDRANKVIDLLEVINETVATDANTPGLDAFLAGFKAGRREARR